jgi:RNA polymerase sigma-70 factor, ECF subfamily
MTNSADSHEKFIELLARHEGVIRASIRAVIRRPEDVDEVMQAVSLTAWRRYDSVTDTDGFAKWACVIARYEILKFQREKARDRFELDEALIAKIVDEGADELKTRSPHMAHLEDCLKQLPEMRRLMVLQAYAPGCSMKTLAERLGKSQEGLYQLLRRIRLELKDCVEMQNAREGGLTR